MDPSVQTVMAIAMQEATIVAGEYQGKEPEAIKSTIARTISIAQANKQAGRQMADTRQGNRKHRGKPRSELPCPRVKRGEECRLHQQGVCDFKHGKMPSGDTPWKPTCWNCGKQGHRSTNCRSKRAEGEPLPFKPKELVAKEEK